MKLLRKVDICGQTFRVSHATAKEDPNLEDAHGCCLLEQAHILIAPGRAETVQLDTLMHEIMHAVFSITALSNKLEAAEEHLNANQGPGWLEEEIIGTLTPSLRAALKSAGWKEPKKV